jgi:hypothetical protein
MRVYDDYNTRCAHSITSDLTKRSIGKGFPAFLRLARAAGKRDDRYRIKTVQKIRPARLYSPTQTLSIINFIKSYFLQYLDTETSSQSSSIGGNLAACQWRMAGRIAAGSIERDSSTGSHLKSFSGECSRSMAVLESSMVGPFDK